MKETVLKATIEEKIYLIRGKRVMIDRDLAALYGVETRYLNKAVKRNSARFPSDFMFQLSKEEYNGLMFQIGTSKGHGGTRKLPYVFTQEGVAMLSGVLHSHRAVQVNIEIMRAFVKLRTILIEHKDLKRKVEDIEKKFDGQFRIVFDAIRQLLEPPTKPKRRIGFR
jgi:hypothetical protein